MPDGGRRLRRTGDEGWRFRVTGLPGHRETGKRRSKPVDRRASCSVQRVACSAQIRKGGAHLVFFSSPNPGVRGGAADWRGRRRIHAEKKNRRAYRPPVFHAANRLRGLATREFKLGGLRSRVKDRGGGGAKWKRKTGELIAPRPFTQRTGYAPRTPLKKLEFDSSRVNNNGGTAG